MQRYGIHLEGKRGHQRGCRRYPEGASDFRPQQIGQVHALSLSLSIINVPLGFTSPSNEPWRPRHMCISYYGPWSMAHAIVVISSNETRINPSMIIHYLIQNCNISSNFFFFFWKNSQLNQDIPCKYREILWNGGKVGEWEIYDRSACHSPVHSFKWD